MESAGHESALNCFRECLDTNQATIEKRLNSPKRFQEVRCEHGGSPSARNTHKRTPFIIQKKDRARSGPYAFVHVARLAFEFRFEMTH